MKLKKIKIALITLLFLLMSATISKAAFSANSPTVTTGSDFNINISSSNALDAYNVYLNSYDGLTFLNCSKSDTGAMVSINGGNIGYVNASGTTKNLGTYRFKAPQVTESKTYTISFKVEGATVKSTVKVNPVKKDESKPATSSNNGGSSKSSDATLKSLSVKGVSLNKKFSANTTKYSVSVGNNIDNVTVNAKANSSKAKVSITGNKNLKVGGNTVNITVTAEDGTQKVYKINVSRQADEGAIQSNPEEDDVTPEEINLKLKSLEIEGFTLTPEFSSDVYEYRINIPKDSDITKLNITAIGDKDNFIIDINGNEELVDGENIITITVKSPDTADVATYKIIVNKEVETVEAIANTIDEEPVEVNNHIGLRIAMAASAAVLAIAGIIFAVIEYRYGKNINNNQDELGAIPYSNIGFKSEEVKESKKLNKKESKEENNENFLKDIKSNLEKKAEEETNTNATILGEDNSKKKGKHF